MHFLGLDEQDNAILNLIKDNARMSYSEIGERIGLSRPAVKNRMDALQEKGIIQGYHTVINASKMSEGVKFIIDIEASMGPLRMSEVEAAQKKIYQIWKGTQ